MVHPFLSELRRAIASTVPRQLILKKLFRINMVFALGSVSFTQSRQYESPVLGYYATGIK